MFPESPRLNYRVIEDADFDWFAGIQADSEIMHFIGVRTNERSREIIGIYRDLFVKHGFTMYVLTQKSDGARIGYCGLKDFHYKGFEGEVELGYILDKTYWGRGYATEASAACVKFAKERLRVPQLYALVRLDNTASYRVVEKVGFVKTDIQLEERKDHGVWIWTNRARIV